MSFPTNRCARPQQIGESTWTSLAPAPFEAPGEKLQRQAACASSAGRNRPVGGCGAALSGSCVESRWGCGKDAPARSRARGRGGEGRPGQAAVGDSTLGQTWPRPAWAARVAADSAVRGSLSQDTAREGRTERLAQEDSAALQGLLQQRAGSGGGVGGVQREGDHAARRGGASNTRRVCATLSRTRAVQRLRRIALPFST